MIVYLIEHYTRNLLNSSFTNGVTFSSINQNSFIIFNQKDNTSYLLNLNSDFTIKNLDLTNLSFPFLAANANLDLNDINNDGILDFLFGSRNGGIQLYLGDKEKQISVDYLKIYPNPRENNLQYFLLPENAILQKIELYDILGRFLNVSYIKLLNKITVQFPEMAKGIYFVVVYLNDKKIVHKSIYL